jgi:hypothetical protein
MGWGCQGLQCLPGLVRPPAMAQLSGLVLAGQRLSGVILFRYLIWRMRYGGQITIAGNGVGKVGT